MTETGTWVSTDATHPEAAGPPLHPLAAPPATLQQRWQRLSLAAKMERLGWAQVTNGLWARWDSPDGEGNIMGVTWKMRVVSPEGCPNGVYVEANVLDTSGTVVGFTNAMLPSLGANSQALMELSTATGEQRVSLEPTKASCY
ncbi:hypothetical protein [Nocardioides soli]|uniref:Uncharacterized protein n=1 Tax=Nocardioides soli TaxID=1036020 RepID=A0A7W4Z0J5_9ACTN|nr:hypothetical protein [Nocardioides soli]MBB3041972.1 hypothetical protein [Nocardioides soli]